MKILHTADWHLGKKLDNFSRLEEQKAVLAEICEIADKEDVDAVIIAGDLYDTFTPPTEAVTLFYKTVKKLAKNGRRAVVAIAGNHDSPDRIEAPEPLALECGIFLLGFPYSQIQPFELETGLTVTKSEKGFLELKLPNQATPLRLILTPFANELRLKTYLGMDNREEELSKLLEQKWQSLADKYCDNQGINMLVAHLFMIKKGEDMPDENLDEEKSILYVGGSQALYSSQIPKQIQYVALGHLHGKRIVDTEPCPIVYSSSPLTYSFSDRSPKKYVMLIEAEADKVVNYKAIPLTQGKALKKGKFESVEEAIIWLKVNQETLVEITIISDHYLTAVERRQLHDSHTGIKAIIPQVRVQGSEKYDLPLVDLDKDRTELFRDYFRHKNNQEPNEGIMDLFKELLSK